MKFVLAAVLAAAVSAITPPHLNRMKEQHLARRREVAMHDGAALPPDLWFNQTLDHFEIGPQNPATWQQRFWVNDTFWNGDANAPVFLYVEGEGAGSPLDVVYGQHVELAESFGALVVALEHRFYGASLPKPDLSVESLKYLSSHQAIADLAEFVKAYLYPTYNLGAANRIVTFGGSYPGALSAWIRLRLPHLIFAAFSTSSPVEAIADFQGYNNVVASSLAYEAVGGSAQCLSNVKAAFQAFTSAMNGDNGEKTAMSNLMYSCAPALDTNDIMMMASNVAGNIMGVVQYNDEQPGIDVRGICEIMTQPGVTPIIALSQVVNATLGGAPCIDNSYTDFIAQMRNVTADPGATGVGDRQWTWQTCSQFGYYQACDVGTQCPFSPLMTLASSFQQCVDIFGPEVNEAVNVNRIAFTNDYLGGYSVSESVDRIIFTNGGVDPWHMLSVTPERNENPDNLSLFIPTGAHCRQMFASKPNDPADVKKARAAAAAQLKTWLAE